MKLQLIEKDWGPKKLLDSKTLKMCCLGQAAYQLGVPKDLLMDIAMPRGVSLMCPQETSLKDFSDFQYACGKVAPIAFRDAIRGTTILESHIPSERNSIAYCIAYVNDNYFDGHMLCSKERVIELIVEGFKIMGYELEFVPAEVTP